MLDREHPNEVRCDINEIYLEAIPCEAIEEFVLASPHD